MLVIGFIIFLPFALIITILIKLSSTGPVFYKQKRVGFDGRHFNMIKFRTMYQDAESGSKIKWSKPRTDKITGPGRILRKTSLDEVPQLINVLKGDMSLVGPRPERPEFVEKFKETIPKYMLRHKIKTGITGWAQVKHKYDATIEDVKQKVMFDLYYFENMSLLLDLKILLRTVIVVFTGKGAR